MAFIENQKIDVVHEYKSLLEILGSLSRLFSVSEVPFLYYRASENLFCIAFDAIDKTRNDIAIDAKKDEFGIGIKTFIMKQNSSIEKIAEFNAQHSTYSSLSGIEKIKQIAKLRNQRLDHAKALTDTSQLIYHCITRRPGKFVVYEESMDYIDLDAISLSNQRGSANVTTFNDGKNEYSWNESKSTLYKKFILPEQKYLEIDIEILDDPIAALRDVLQSPKPLPKKSETMFSSMAEKIVTPESELSEGEFVFLPLYAPSSKFGEEEVAKKSGLNQWNAGGRARHSREVYIPIPAWIHKEFPDFFPPKDESFKIKLPTDDTLEVKVCQQGGKALMSNPNRDLGEWLLDEVLSIPEYQLVTYQDLLDAGIDSVLITKIDGVYSIYFKKIGEYEKFKTNSFFEGKEVD